MGIWTFYQEIDQPTTDQLLKANLSDDQLRRFINAAADRPRISCSYSVTMDDLPEGCDEEEMRQNADQDTFELLNEIIKEQKKDQKRERNEGEVVATVKRKKDDPTVDDTEWKEMYLSFGEVSETRVENIEELIDQGMTSWEALCEKQKIWNQMLEQGKVADVDKTQSAIEYLIAKFKKIKIERRHQELALDEFLQVHSVGDDVCYGPIYIISAEKTKAFYDLVKDITFEDLEKTFGFGVPEVLGGMMFEDGNQDEDLSYIWLNFNNLRFLLQNASARNNGLVRHFF
eukprot:TRINITY_DN4141_c0_g1_i1.p1 TRINITY_DN4141_c0_g1~~TRINITY_DN4141_c0_g1_i1.p1  ORF type:complete len:287 (-),score=76.87 TRINITY_DN4141_c0_g1_i1:33-893(-)